MFSGQLDWRFPNGPRYLLRVMPGQGTKRTPPPLQGPEEFSGEHSTPEAEKAELVIKGVGERGEKLREKSLPVREDRKDGQRQEHPARDNGLSWSERRDGGDPTERLNADSEPRFPGFQSLPPPTSSKTLIVVESLSYVPLFHDPTDHSPPGSSVHGISQARILE